MALLPAIQVAEAFAYRSRRSMFSIIDTSDLTPIGMYLVPGQMGHRAPQPAISATNGKCQKDYNPFAGQYLNVATNWSFAASLIRIGRSMPKR